MTINQDFEGVIRGCSNANQRMEQEGAWLGEDIIQAYTEMHRQGFAASIEVWENQNLSEPRQPFDPQQSSGPQHTPRLVGGLYGITLRHAFFGESMFSLVPNASKLALIHLAQLLVQVGGRLIDCQFETPHLLSMGGRHISYEEYLEILDRPTLSSGHLSR